MYDALNPPLLHWLECIEFSNLKSVADKTYLLNVRFDSVDQLATVPDLQTLIQAANKSQIQIKIKIYKRQKKKNSEEKQTSKTGLKFFGRPNVMRRNAWRMQYNKICNRGERMQMDPILPANLMIKTVKIDWKLLYF